MLSMQWYFELDIIIMLSNLHTWHVCSFICIKVLITTVERARLPRFQLWPLCALKVQQWTSYLTSSKLSFHIWKLGC